METTRSDLYSRLTSKALRVTQKDCTNHVTLYNLDSFLRNKPYFSNVGMEQVIRLTRMGDHNICNLNASLVPPDCYFIAYCIVSQFGKLRNACTFKVDNKCDIATIISAYLIVMSSLSVIYNVQ